MLANAIPWSYSTESGDTIHQTYSKFEPLTSEATSRSRRLPTILNPYEWAVEFLVNFILHLITIK